MFMVFITTVYRVLQLLIAVKLLGMVINPLMYAMISEELLIHQWWLRGMYIIGNTHLVKLWRTSMGIHIPVMVGSHGWIPIKKEDGHNPYYLDCFLTPCGRCININLKPQVQAEIRLDILQFQPIVVKGFWSLPWNKRWFLAGTGVPGTPKEINKARFTVISVRVLSEWYFSSLWGQAEAISEKPNHYLHLLNHQRMLGIWWFPEIGGPQ